MMNHRLLILLIITAVLAACGKTRPGTGKDASVTVGAEVLIDRHFGELEGKRVGLVMNPTARIGTTHMLDTLIALNVNVTALFAPEHGFRGEAGAGEVIEDGVDQETGLPVYSLYGDTRKPTPDMLEAIDLLLFDMQDVGARFYTYNVTLGLVLEAAATADVPLWVLDRPNPAGGEYVSGWILREEYRSFVGAYPIPMAHGMTLGELAGMMVGEQWINIESTPQLRVIEMGGWERSMKWPDTGLAWFPPSPNLPTFEHAFVYMGTVLFEGTTLSEGRGTDDPFLTIGSPATEITDGDLAVLGDAFPSLEIERTTFTPRSIPGKALNPKHEGVTCRGVRISVGDYDRFRPVTFGVRLLEVMLASTPGAGTREFIYKLAGTKAVTEFDMNWKDEIQAFRERRKEYLIY
ncbi:MAG: DUF1343 domain-containing protein [Balneolaceae bacterium]|nr:DUF1343 domain-containing protein [Balneolaceae bacterium]